jgi:Tfp pilus assembly protein PilE
MTAKFLQFKRNITSQNCQSGVTLIELILVVLTIAFLALLINNLPSSISSINKSRHASIARDIVTQKLDSLRKLTYTNLSNGTNDFTDPNLTNLPNSTAIYIVEDCPASICTSSEASKKVTVEVSWKESGDIKKIQLVTLVSDGGIGQ